MIYIVKTIVASLLFCQMNFIGGIGKRIMKSPVILAGISVHFDQMDDINYCRERILANREHKSFILKKDTASIEMMVSFKVDNPKQINTVYYDCKGQNGSPDIFSDSGTLVQQSGGLYLVCQSSKMVVKAHSIYARFSLKRSEIKKLETVTVMIKDVNGLVSKPYTYNYSHIWRKAN